MPISGCVTGCIEPGARYQDTAPRPSRGRAGDVAACPPQGFLWCWHLAPSTRSSAHAPDAKAWPQIAGAGSDAWNATARRQKICRRAAPSTKTRCRIGEEAIDSTRTLPPAAWAAQAVARARRVRSTPSTQHHPPSSPPRDHSVTNLINVLYITYTYTTYSTYTTPFTLRERGSVDVEMEDIFNDIKHLQVNTCF